MRRAVIILSLGAFLAVSCERKEQGTQISGVSFTPCQQSILKSDSQVDVEFTNNGVQITHYNFAVTCDFTTVDVSHTFVNGVLNITQQGYPNQAKCICYTDVSYTINGILENEVNVIFINGEQVYCHNGNNHSDCDQGVIISADEYENAPNDLFTITEMKIVNNCLKIKFWGSGCEGSTWVVKLIDCGVVAESIPCQRTLRLSLEDNEDCRAIIEKKVSFNIEDLQIQGNHSIQLNISGKSILYEY